jgi:hypothetical protein
MSTTDNYVFKFEKKLLFSIMLILFFSTTQAQYSRKSFRIDMGLGLSYPTNAIPNGFGIGILSAIEPKYDINRFSIGSRIGFNVLRSSPNNEQLAENQTDKFDMNLLLVGDFHFTTSKFRPFIGIGTGIYILAATPGYDITSESGTWNNYGAKLGSMIRAGFDVSHVRVSVQYDIIGNKYHNSYGNINFNYISMSVYGYIGGK